MMSEYLTVFIPRICLKTFISLAFVLQLVFSPVLSFAKYLVPFLSEHPCLRVTQGSALPRTPLGPGFVELRLMPSERGSSQKSV